MKKCLFLFLGLALSSFLFISCHNSKSAIANLEDLVSEVEESSSDLTEKDLEVIADKYAEVETELQKYEYTDEELREIGRLKGQYLAKMSKIALKNIKSTINGFNKQLEGGMEGFMEEMEKE